MEDRSNHLRGVALEVVVDVDSDTGVATDVCTRECDLRWVSTTTPSDRSLRTANVLWCGVNT